MPAAARASRVGMIPSTCAGVLSRGTAVAVPRGSRSRVKYLLLLSPRQAPGTLKNGTEHGRGHERANDAVTREASILVASQQHAPNSAAADS